MMLNKKIIICDDDEGILDMMEMILDDEGYQIIAESNSLNLRSIIERESPDLIILDLWMPMLSGDQLLRMIRDTEAYKHLPVLVISASRDGETIAMDAGASGFLAKPFDIDGLLGKIELQLSATNWQA
ncbi:MULTISPECIES: response regulator [unclassified Pedobacter]|uniref:response regulator n=1 Tax=unclassified Pedobacter TaxID=2628915 RepID=UPI001E441402|nr:MULTISPECIES: response regulator [unclassified Pedobacter]